MFKLSRNEIRFIAVLLVSIPGILVGVASALIGNYIKRKVKKP